MAVQVQTKNQRRREKLKARKQEAKQAAASGEAKTEPDTKNEDVLQETLTPDEGNDDGRDSEIEITTADFDPDDPLYQQYKYLLTGPPEPVREQVEHVHYDDEEDNIPDEEDDEENDGDSDNEGNDDDLTQATPMSKSKRKKQKASVAELKSSVDRPEQVEWYDVSAREPRVTIAIKSSRNMVPIPNHWSVKREYLSSKRGQEKTPFALPKFIADTGITAMRDAALDRQSKQSLKQKQRERVAPKMGKLDVDYSKLFEAFFKFQEKPHMSHYGEVYFEGKENESDRSHLKAGDLTDDLKEALGMPLGAPPPWLLGQQRFGAPTAYPSLKTPGLNAPIPIGAEWGYHPGGWGKPPVDDQGRPLYNLDIYGAAEMKHKKGHQQQQPQEHVLKVPTRQMNKNLWGQLMDVEEDPEEDEEEEDDEEDDEGDEIEQEAPRKPTREANKPSGRPGSGSGTAPSGQTAFVSQDLNEDFTLRKSRPDSSSTKPRSAGQVLKESSVEAKGFFGSDRRYEIPPERMLGQEDSSKKRKAGDVDVAVDLDRLEREGKISKDEMAKMYSSGKKAEQNPQWGRSELDQQDLDNMIAEESNKRRKKEDTNDRRRRG